MTYSNEQQSGFEQPIETRGQTQRNIGVRALSGSVQNMDMEHIQTADLAGEIRKGIHYHSVTAEKLPPSERVIRSSSASRQRRPYFVRKAEKLKNDSEH